MASPRLARCTQPPRAALKAQGALARLVPALPLQRRAAPLLLRECAARGVRARRAWVLKHVLPLVSLCHGAYRIVGRAQLRSSIGQGMSGSRAPVFMTAHTAGLNTGGFC